MNQSVSSKDPMLTRSGTSVLEQVGLKTVPDRAAIRSKISVGRLCVYLGGILVVGVLMWCSLYLAAMRIYQVDECMEMYVATILAGMGEKALAGHVTLFQLILSFLIPPSGSSTELLASGRLVMQVVFWLNWILMACATGARLMSGRWVVALLFAATLAPMWDCGFEVRHDNLMLTGILLIWCLVRFSRPSIWTYFTVGILVTGLEFIAFKSFAYTLPLSMAILIFPPFGATTSRWRLALSWFAGLVGCFALLRFWFGYLGVWEHFGGAIPYVLAHGSGFEGSQALPRLLSQAPLLSAAIVAAFLDLAVKIHRKGAEAVRWDGMLPEAFLCLGTLVFLPLSTAPSFNGLLSFVPFTFLFGFRYFSQLWDEFGSKSALAPISLSLVLFAHLVPFAGATIRHLNFSNAQQEKLIALAENVTASGDRVYDGTGMVLTRQTAMRNVSVPSRSLDKRRPAAVLLPSYLTDALSDGDQAFIRKRYVSLTDDFMVLGEILPEGGGVFEIVHPGRYRISTLAGSDLSGTYQRGFDSINVPEDAGEFQGTLNGLPMKTQVVDLTVGKHCVTTSDPTQLAVVWVGPRIDRYHRVSEGDHRRTFVNWY